MLKRERASDTEGMAGQVGLGCLSRTEGQPTFESLMISTILQVSFQGRTIEKSTDRLSSKRTTWKGGLNAQLPLSRGSNQN